MGQIITFYSYKGGVGRTFALANVAAQLALWGYKVLVIDWDLEAPGLHHYFGRFLSPTIAPRALCDRPGLIEYIERWQTDSNTDWNSYVQKAQLLESPNTIDLIFAGEQTDDYGARARGVDWDELYRKHDLGAHLDRVGEEWRKAYDFTFIDSRTGLSDTAGICTVQLPDILALILTASYQSVSGTAWIGERALTAASSSSGRGLAFQVPIVSRFAEKEEITLAGQWRSRIAQELDDLYKAWRPKEIRSEQLIEFLKLPHVARWTYGEEVPVIEETLGGSQSIITNTELISYHVQTLAALFAHQMTDIQSLVSERSSYVSRAAQRAVSVRTETGAVEGDVVKLLGELQSKASEAAALGDHSTAISYWNDILAKAESTLGPESPAVLSALRNLSQSLQTVGRASEAEPLLRRALSLGEKIFGGSSPEIWGDLSNLVYLLQDSGRRSEAERLAKRALKIAERNFGSEHASTKLARESLESVSKKDFFISYSRADRVWAEWIAWQLEEAGGYSVVIQGWDFGPGSNFVSEMDRAIKGCERVVAVLSPDYITSLFARPEWAVYFAQDSASERRLIVPVLIRECKLEGLLAQIVYLDLVGKEESAAKTDLLNAVRIGRRKPEKAPSFPSRAIRVIGSKPRFPGALPDVWNVPHNRNPNYTETGERLAQLRAAFQSGKTAGSTQSLTGLGGVGKTQIAVEYAYRHAGDYAIVWWIRAEKPETLASDYAALAAELGLPERDAHEQPLIVAAVRNALRHTPDWLLIFDNANAPDEIRSFLPQGGGHVLITSRDPAWGGVAQSLPVKKWPPAVAIEFLVKRTGDVDAEAARELARELDYLPLALEQAAAYVESTTARLSSYLELYRKHQLELFKRSGPSSDYPATVATTWEVGFQQIEKESTAATSLINLCAFFAPDDIPRDMIVAGVDDLPEPLRGIVSDELSFDDAIGVIRRYSLIESTGGTSLSMNRLVQAVARNRLATEDQKRWAEVAVEIVNRAFPADSDDVRTWNDCARLLPHGKSAANFAETLHVGAAPTARLLNRMGSYLRGRAEYQEAKAALGRALVISENFRDPYHPAVSAGLNDLGGVLQDLGDLAGAKAAFERALKIDEVIFDPDHPVVAIGVNNLGGVLKASGDLAGAKAAFERALKIGEKALGPDHPAVAIRVNNLGGVLQALGDLTGAKAAFERALTIDEKAYGPDHPTVAVGLNNLGGLLQALGDLTGAKAAFERALTIDERAFGPDHPTVAIRVNNLGGVLRDLGDLAGAKAAYEQALEIDEIAFGPDHPEVAIDVNNLGGVLGALGDMAGAKAAFERALKIGENAFDPDYPTVAIRVNNLGSVLQDLGDLAGAKGAYERALAIFRKFLGEDHPKTQAVRENLDSVAIAGRER